MFFGFYLPNVEIYPNGEVQAFFRIHNDMGVALMAGLPIFILYLSKYNRRYKIFKFIIFLSLIFYISYINDTKTALLSILIFLFIFVFNYFLLSHKVIIKLFTLIVICIVSVSSVLIAYKYNPTLKFANETVHINELILDPVIRIVNLDMYPMDSWGSVENRVNALIIALKVYANSYMIGIGYGNSVSVLSLPEYELKAAKSMHNDVIVWLLEFGILVFCIYLLFIIKIFILFFKSYSLINNIRISIFFSFPIGILSSSGVTSNYYFIICLFTLLFYKENNENIIYNR
ncbi:MAG: O-antigen ligase family protein [Campylobacterales bacterium]|nr:O-antigen ligase family protein [Campylobacterales bacterium]